MSRFERSKAGTAALWQHPAAAMTVIMIKAIFFIFIKSDFAKLHIYNDICSEENVFMRFKSAAARYGISTLGLVIVALGVALSIKSNLGTAPPSCPPTIMSLKWSAISVGTFTWMLHIVFILIQLAILRKDFKWEYLMQLPAAFVFGYLCDGAIWLFNAIDAPATGYAAQLGLSLLSVLLTAIGIKLEVIGDGWILAGDKLTAVIADTSGAQFGNVKIIFDVVLVAITVGFAMIAFGNPFGDGSTVVMREGTAILAIFTGLCMKVTDPLIDRLFRRK